MVQQQTYQNIMYWAGLEALKRLAVQLNWDQKRLEIACAELAKKYQPSSGMIQ